MSFALTRKSLICAALASTVLVGAVAAEAAVARPFVDQFHRFDTIASAVPTSGPAMGDQNPYGVAVVPRSKGMLKRGDVLVSNFNNGQNQQGTGSSIVEVSPRTGKARVFAVVPQPTSTPAVGLTTALVVLRDGYVIVGSLPAPGGDSTMATAGALSVLNWEGHVVETIKAGDINGPWDMTAVEGHGSATLFVTNVLNGTVAAAGGNVDKGTVVRITLSLRHGRTPRVISNTVIGDGFTEHTDPNALVVGPTGVGLGRDDVLYVADSNGNRIAAIPHAMTRFSRLGGGGMTVSQGGALNDPLGLTITPNGHILSANGADGNLVETTPGGQQIAVKDLIPDGGGDLFGLAIAPFGDGIYLVNDIGSGPMANSLEILH
jgi:sugar lactone lactonase YvrE